MGIFLIANKIVGVGGSWRGWWLRFFVSWSVGAGILFSQESHQIPWLEKVQTPAYVPSSRAGYLGISVALTFGGTLLGAGVLFLMPETVTNWSREDIKNLGPNYIHKVTQGPKVDPDDLWLNWVGHPYWGAVYYLQARRAGFNWVFSSVYSFMLSTFLWEFGIEGFAETPSWQDLVVTPAVGALVGELFYWGINEIQKNDSKVLDSRFLGGLCLLVMDPIGFIIQDLQLGSAIGIKNKKDFRSFYLPKKDGVNFVISYRW